MECTPPPRPPTNYFSAATALRPQEAAMTALVRLAIYCFIHLQGIHFDLVVDIIIIVSVYFWVQFHMLHYSILAYSIINFLDRKFWIFRICMIKWSIREPWECYHWNNLHGGVDGETKLTPSNIGTHSSSLNSNINNTSINTSSIPASSHITFDSFRHHGRNSRFVEFVSICWYLSKACNGMI